MRNVRLLFLLLGACGPRVPAQHPKGSPASTAGIEAPTATVTRSMETDVPPTAEALTTTASRSAPPEHGAHTGHPQTSEAVTFACPMHPEVTADKAGARCSKCGMNLVKKE